MTGSPDRQLIIEATHQWLEKVVIGLNLCPFAALPWRQGRVRFRVSEATNQQQLAQDLADELLALQASDPAECETTLLIHPHVLGDFFDYNDFLELADRLVEDLALDGTIQVASFHPDYQFADSQPDDPANCTNRSPYPMLHLLREASIEVATANMPDPDMIYERNIKTLQALGMDGWKALMKGTRKERSE
ncbi:DUF1415 domain-containing protein [Wenzhouxiangella sp. EGI_FJ10305]|uniref:DUF1415 domain-containing protein n=1 Tax=Wenzhouxiangella sp. EGI_FJ10305 TaxID=3243768 RepID=UPI0035D82657